MTFEVRIPTLGESVTEGVIVRWAKQDGEAVKPDDVLLELETDKASMELPAARAVGPLSPAVRRLLAEHDLDPTLVPASGKGGRLTKEDVLAYLERSARPVRIEVPAAPTPSAALVEGEERVPMSPIRRRIAERLVQAQRTAAILTTFNELDMSAVIALRAGHKG